MSTIDKATRTIRVWEGVSEQSARCTATMLDDEGLLAPTPQIIRTDDEVLAGDPDTLVVDSDGDVWTLSDACTGEGTVCLLNHVGLPAVVIVTGETVRACREILEGETVRACREALEGETT